MEIDLVGESLKFMVLGMTIVFIFLFVLVQLVKVQAKIINMFFPEKVPSATTPPSSSQESDHVAAIIAAVTEFRKNQ
ncbi:MAG: Na+-transporting oxaloacetate decarboxylase subunit gamma [Sulfurovum sp.]|nr:MAG: Na+-transporting oxaloacetate decarboxylase subunit gamma [Sulfurovum sp.]RUM71681.1 MAG: Na+-transporting oxaloacetate decarboxylase subunit gamma [Sulfurovum sp.]RUM77071.1 MAG: Na+-transporting oxaloacetate decarboxylase subunit gamma [Sulfurovum sp.]